MIKKFLSLILFAIISIPFHFSIAKGIDSTAHMMDPPYFIDYQKLKESVKKFSLKKEPYFSYGNFILSEANSWLDTAYYTITNKKYLPESNNRNDYYSRGPYWWPDPSKGNGLPYIRKDGLVNPEYFYYDSPLLKRMIKAVRKLTIAYMISNNDIYKNKALGFINAWFIDEETKMNPNLNYGQAIPGITTGRGIGIIETLGLVDLVDMIGILYNMNAICDNDYKIVQKWFADYNYWLNNSKNGIDEKNWYNNHGTAYDLQVISFSLFTQNIKLAKSILDSVKTKRINTQITPNGRQPYELERTKAMGYSIMNLSLFTKIALIAEKFKINLWDYESEDGRSIAKAINFLLPYLFEGKEWPYKELGNIKKLKNRFIEILSISNNRTENYRFSKYFQYYESDNYELQKQLFFRPNTILNK